ncbi:tRNA-splicing endonuclease subunit Sen54 isoform X1 [Cloeon dipterum]|uniref:tRNA-splicing endonuclease subunit Sen54 isoform X1 n=2 Tax=Cloeon dipterum TaxID=197152 RepID=UPI00322088A5
MLSAKELSAGMQKNQGQTDPLKRGQKLNTPSGTWSEENEVERCRSDLVTLLSAQRIEKKSLRSVAEWVPAKGLAMVTRKQGRCWTTFGVELGKLLWLRPEEALFLMETNTLELQFGGVSLSVQQAHNLILSSSLHLSHYQVYSKLQRLGWVVLPRCRQTPEPPPLIPAKAEAPKVEVIDLDAEDESGRCKAFERYVPNILNQKQWVVRVAPAHLLPPNINPSRQEYLLRFGGDPQQMPSLLGRLGPPPLNSQIFHPRQPQQQLTFSLQQTQFRGSYFHAQRFELQVQSQALMHQQGPRHWHPRPRWPQQHHQPRGRHNNNNRRRQRKQPRDEIPHYERASAPSGGRGQQRPRFKNWTELKAKKGAVETITLEPDEERLNECGLLQPDHCKSYKTVLSKLQIFRSASPAAADRSRKLELKYDVYMPSAHFRKSAPPTPVCHIAILSQHDEVPSEAELNLAEDGKEAPIVFAVVLLDSIQFISLSGVDLKLVS